MYISLSTNGIYPNGGSIYSPTIVSAASHLANIAINQASTGGTFHPNHFNPSHFFIGRGDVTSFANNTSPFRLIQRPGGEGKTHQIYARKAIRGMWPSIVTGAKTSGPTTPLSKALGSGSKRRRTVLCTGGAAADEEDGPEPIDDEEVPQDSLDAEDRPQSAVMGTDMAPPRTVNLPVEPVKGMSTLTGFGGAVAKQFSLGF